MSNRSLIFGIIFTLFTFAAKLPAQNEMIVWKPTIGGDTKGTLTLAGDTKSIRTAVFSPDGTRIATSSDDGTVKIWDAKTGAELNTLIGYTDHVWSSAFNKNRTKALPPEF